MLFNDAIAHLFPSSFVCAVFIMYTIYLNIDYVNTSSGGQF